jgi:hypothetical protein
VFITVNEPDLLALMRTGDRNVNGKSRFTHATLGIRDCQNHIKKTPF